MTNLRKPTPHETQQVRIRQNLWREAKVAAAHEGVTLEAWLNHAIEQGLDTSWNKFVLQERKDG